MFHSWPNIASPVLDVNIMYIFLLSSGPIFRELLTGPAFLLTCEIEIKMHEIFGNLMYNFMSCYGVIMHYYAFHMFA